MAQRQNPDPGVYGVYGVGSLLLWLPPDVWASIWSLLPPSSMAALRVSCKSAWQLCDPLINAITFKPTSSPGAQHDEAQQAAAAVAMARRLPQLNALYVHGFTAEQLAEPLRKGGPFPTVEFLDVQGEALASGGAEALLPLLPSLTQACFGGAPPPALGDALLACSLSRLWSLQLKMSDAAGQALASSVRPVLRGLAGLASLQRLTVTWEPLPPTKPAAAVAAALHASVCDSAREAFTAVSLPQLRSLVWRCCCRWDVLPALAAAAPGLTSLCLDRYWHGPQGCMPSPPLPGALAGAFKGLTRLDLCDGSITAPVWNHVVAALPGLRSLYGIKLLQLHMASVELTRQPSLRSLQVGFAPTSQSLAVVLAAAPNIDELRVENLMVDWSTFNEPVSGGAALLAKVQALNARLPPLLLKTKLTALTLSEPDIAVDVVAWIEALPHGLGSFDQLAISISSLSSFADPDGQLPGLMCSRLPNVSSVVLFMLTVQGPTALCGVAAMPQLQALMLVGCDIEPAAVLEAVAERQRRGLVPMAVRLQGCEPRAELESALASYGLGVVVEWDT